MNTITKTEEAAILAAADEILAACNAADNIRNSHTTQKRPRDGSIDGSIAPHKRPRRLRYSTSTSTDVFHNVDLFFEISQYLDVCGQNQFLQLAMQQGAGFTNQYVTRVTANPSHGLYFTDEQFQHILATKDIQMFNAYCNVTINQHDRMTAEIMAYVFCHGGPEFVGMALERTRQAMEKEYVYSDCSSNWIPCIQSARFCKTKLYYLTSFPTYTPDLQHAVLTFVPHCERAVVEIATLLVEKQQDAIAQKLQSPFSEAQALQQFQLL
jgi:hypothetical protein